MIGMSRHNGRSIDADAHLAQSITDILTTPVGSMPMLRDYGSELPAIIAQPINPETIIDVFQATAEALAKWEPRIQVGRVQVSDASAGRLSIDLYDVAGNAIAIEVTA